jgi:hypothetical protein
MVFSYCVSAIFLADLLTLNAAHVRASKIGVTICGAKLQVSLPEPNSPFSSSLAVPTAMVSEMRGKKAARAAPIKAYAPHIVKLMIFATDPRWISLLLLSSVRAKSLYLDTLLLPADKPVWIYFLEDSQE